MKNYITFFVILFFAHSYTFAQFTTVGSTVTNGNCFDLTQAPLDIGAVWSNTQIDLSNPFIMTATLDMGDISTTEADGIAFVMQQEGTSFIGAEGGNLGYVGYMGVFDVPNNTLGAAFRTFTHDRLEIWNNSVSDISGMPYDLPAVSGPQPITITWSPSTTTFTIDFGNDGIDISWVNDIINNYFGGDPLVYWGFTSATGADANFAVNSACDIQMNVITPIPTMGEWGLIFLALIILTMGSVVVLNADRQLVLTSANTGKGSLLYAFHKIPFDAKAYGKILIATFSFVVLGFVIAIIAFGYSLTNADIPGVIVCTPLLAYLLYLMKVKAE